VSLIFDGFDDWPENQPVIECYVDGELRDLHNCAWFDGMWWRSFGELWFWFDYDDRLCGGTARSRRLGLGFGDVRGLAVEQVADFDPREGRTFESVWYRSNATTASDVEIQAGGLMATFIARWVRLWEEPGPDKDAASEEDSPAASL